ncbi:hypothetical protein [Hydrogenophaga sp. 5NK40-0174]|uniref:hypothetical protein n=1 Tax=Hydrogenophaga sp. 5NK40-0174 TaxID=3127649 RepID=UPI00310511EA
MKKPFVIAAAVAVSTFLASCGGGGDESGDGGIRGELNPVHLSADEQKYTFQFCNVLYNVNTRVTIIGGEPPFRVHVSDPDRVKIDIDYFDTGRDPIFTILQVGGCDSKYVITVLDKNSGTATLEITTEKAEDEES